MKTVPITMPTKRTDPEEWVHGARTSEAAPTTRSASSAEPMKRFTIDVPLELHTRIKTQCAMRGAKMADVLRDLLEREFPKP